MCRTFKITKDYYNEDEILYKKDEFTINPNVTVLVGCNGSGKSTMLQEIKRQLKKEKIPCIYFDNLSSGGANARSKAGFYGNMNFLATAICSSEGENIMMNTGTLATKIGTIARKYRDDKELWVLLDAIDSGLSVDNILDIKDLFDLVIEDNKNRDVYIIISANEYELARNEQCFDVYNCKYITFKDYEDYRNFIIKSREIKNNRYKD